MNAGRRFVLVIDEAQNLDEKVLESIRLLSNFETPWMKLMQIVISGQPSLAEKLSRPSMVQLRQRISLLIHIAPFNREEIDAYIDHRLFIAGCSNAGVFTAEARRLIAEHSEGIPRNINNLCFNAMSLACATKQKAADAATVLEVLADLELDPLFKRPSPKTVGTQERPILTISKPQPLGGTRRGWVQGWAAKVAVGGALVLATITAVNKNEGKTVKPPSGSESADVEQLPAPTQLPILLDVIEPSVNQSRMPVQISEGQTLSRISVENLGRYDQGVLEELRNLNPWLRDPNYIQTGRRIVMPSFPAVPSSGRIQSTQGFSYSLQEEGKE